MTFGNYVKILVCLLWLYMSTCSAKSQDSHKSTMKMTLLTMVDEEMMWNSARDFCRDGYGDLVNVVNQLYAHALEKMDKTIELSRKVWIGLHHQETDLSDVFRWTDCKIVSWTDWEPGEPDELDRKLCGRHTREKNETYVWSMDKCYKDMAFVCADTPGECGYEEDIDKTCSVKTKTTMEDIDTSSDCEKSCSTETEKDDLCWAYEYNDKKRKCQLIFTPDPYVCDDLKTSDEDVILGLRRCFLFTKTIGKAPLNDAREPLVDCISSSEKTTTSSTTTSETTTSSTTTTIAPTTTTLSSCTEDEFNVTMTTEPVTPEATTASSPTTTANNTPTIASSLTTISQTTTANNTPTIASSLTTISQTTTANNTPTIASSPTTTASSLTTISPTTTAINATTTTDSTPTTANVTEITPGITELATATPPTTTMSTTNNASSGTQRQIKLFCGCRCLLKTKLEDLEHLILDKRNVSAYRRKHESAADDRVSAQSFGVSGLLFIVMTLVFVVLLDVVTLFAH